MSQIFTPFKAMGTVTADLPVSIIKGFEVSNIMASIGKSFQLYDVEHLHTLFVGPQMDRRIRAVELMPNYFLTASGTTIHKWKRSVPQAFESHNAKINLMYLFGGKQLLSVSEDNELRVWNPKSLELIFKTIFPQDFHISCILHPDTYLNKVIIGSKEGGLYLYNINSQKIVYSFQGWGCAVTCMAQSPVVDVIGIGLQDGRVIVHNIKLDKTIVVFKEEQGSITSISFRSDQHPRLATGSTSGSITIWDLENKKLLATNHDAHDARINTVRFLQGEPILVSAGGDNCIKVWVFDQADGSCRVLRMRAGNHKPPTSIRYHTQSTVLAASADRSIRMHVTTGDHVTRELSQGTGLAKKAKLYSTTVEDLKLTPVVAFESCTSQRLLWDDMITCHQDDPFAYTWSVQNNRRGRTLRSTEAPFPSPIKAVAISACGNYGFVGSASGWVERYSMQSGLHRGSYTVATATKVKKEMQRPLLENKNNLPFLLPFEVHELNQQKRRKIMGGAAHSSSIQGLASDALNSKLITASLDGTIKLWGFDSMQLLSTMDVGVPIDRILLNRENSLLAVVADDFVLRVFDTETCKLVRKFSGHSTRLTDITFSPNGRWLITAGTDSTLRVWDLVSAHLIDWFQTKSPCRTLNFSPDGDFLATAHTGDVAIYLWANQDYFGKVYLRKVPDVAPRVEMPKPVRAEGQEEAEQEDKSKEEEMMDDEEPKEVESSKEQVSHMITLARAPRSTWQSLANLEAIKKRNKPVEPPQKPKAAPFFLPTIPSLEPDVKFVAKNQEGEEDKPATAQRLLHLESTSKFEEMLVNCDAKGDYTPAFDYMKGLSASAADIELQSISLTENFKYLKLAMDMIDFGLDSNKNFEVVQAYFKVFLKYHGDTIMENPTELGEQAEQLRQKQRETWLRLQTMFHSTLCMIKYFSGLQV